MVYFLTYNRQVLFAQGVGAAIPIENGRHALYLHNASDIPLMIVSTNPGTVWLGCKVGCSLKPLVLKLISGKSDFCDAVSKPSECESDPSGDFRKMNYTQNVLVYRDEIAKVEAAANVTKDDRPREVEPPHPQPFSFPVLYGGKEIYIRGLVTFALNPNYNPKREAEAKAHCEEVQSKWLACEKSSDCTSVEVGCHYWQPVNKKFAEPMAREGKVFCKKSNPAGPQPPSSCEGHVCVPHGG